MKALSILLLCTILLVATQSRGANIAAEARQDTATLKSALNSVNRQYGQAFARSDSSLFLSCYTADACIMPPGSPIICGYDGQLAFFKFAYKSGVRNIVFKTLGLFGLTGQYVTEQGAYEMFDAGSNLIGKGKYLVVWKKVSDGWKMYRDMFSSDKK
jgi:ketosteroid isomerase-like protein